ARKSGQPGCSARVVDKILRPMILNSGAKLLFNLRRVPTVFVRDAFGFRRIACLEIAIALPIRTILFPIHGKEKPLAYSDFSLLLDGRALLWGRGHDEVSSSISPHFPAELFLDIGLRPAIQG